MNEKLQTAKYTIREAHSLLTLIAYSELGSVAGPDGLPVIDKAVIQIALRKICGILDEADDMLDIVDDSLQVAAKKRQGGTA